MKKLVLIGGIVLATAVGLMACYHQSRGPTSASNPNPPAAPAAPALVQVQPGLFVPGDQGLTFDPGAFKPAEPKNTQVVNVPNRVPFRYVLRGDGMDHQLALQGYVEGKQGCRYVDGSVLKCSNSYDGYADLYNPNARPMGRVGGSSSKWAAESASVCEASAEDGGIGGECYDPSEEICDGVSKRAIANASGTCPRQLKCCPDPSAVHERTEREEERGPARARGDSAPRGGRAPTPGDANDVPGDAGQPILRGRGN